MFLFLFEVALYFKSMSNSIDFYNEIFLHVIPVFITVPCCSVKKYLQKFCADVSAEAIAQRCSVQKVFLEISQNSLEHTCARVSFLIKFLIKNTFSYRTPLVGASMPA